MNAELGISGDFPKHEGKRERCALHPNSLIGSCGFYLGYDHGYTPDDSKLLATQFGFDEKLNPFTLLVFEDCSFVESETMHFLRSQEVR